MSRAGKWSPSPQIKSTSNKDTQNLNAQRKRSIMCCLIRTSNIEIIIANKGNVEAIDLEVIGPTALHFWARPGEDAITVNGKNVDIFAFDKETYVLKLIIKKSSTPWDSQSACEGRIVKNQKNGGNSSRFLVSRPQLLKERLSQFLARENINDNRGPHSPHLTSPLFGSEISETGSPGNHFCNIN